MHIITLLMALVLALPSASVPSVSVVARPQNVQPGQTLTVSVSVHSDDAPHDATIRLGTSPALRILSARPYSGTCAPDGDSWRCDVIATPTEPNIIYATVQVALMPCTRTARIWATVNDDPGAAQWVTIERPACAVYIPLAAQHAP